MYIGKKQPYTYKSYGGRMFRALGARAKWTPSDGHVQLLQFERSQSVAGGSTCMPGERFERRVQAPKGWWCLGLNRALGQVVRVHAPSLEHQLGQALGHELMLRSFFH